MKLTDQQHAANNLAWLKRDIAKVMSKCDVQARVPTPAREAQEATASSRPTSTEIASQIEGFEDDFKVCTQMPLP